MKFNELKNVLAEFLRKTITKKNQKVNYNPALISWKIEKEERCGRNVKNLKNKDKRNDFQIIETPLGEKKGIKKEQVVVDINEKYFPTLWKEAAAQI